MQVINVQILLLQLVGESLATGSREMERESLAIFSNCCTGMKADGQDSAEDLLINLFRCEILRFHFSHGTFDFTIT